MSPEDIGYIPIFIAAPIIVCALRFLRDEQRGLRGSALIISGILVGVGWWMNLALGGDVPTLFVAASPIFIGWGIANFFTPPVIGAGPMEFSPLAKSAFSIGTLLGLALLAVSILWPPFEIFMADLYRNLGLPGSKW